MRKIHPLFLKTSRMRRESASAMMIAYMLSHLGDASYMQTVRSTRLVKILVSWREGGEYSNLGIGAFE